ncbi:unnamed protein product [Peniophora sp. CBMAI 1063]|nr:unnamed protein product [Peniophora sp. CBMAI 1063]
MEADNFSAHDAWKLHLDSRLHPSGTGYLEVSVPHVSPSTMKTSIAFSFPTSDIGVKLTDTLVRPMQISQFRRLKVKGLSAPPTSLWHRWFGSAREVQQLTLESSDTLSCIRALGLPLPQSPIYPTMPSELGPPLEEMLFPSLQELTIRDADFTKIVAPALNPGHAAAVMKLTLSKRAYRRCIPRCLMLQDCVADGREFERWTDAVPPDQRDWTANGLNKSSRHMYE